MSSREWWHAFRIKRNPRMRLFCFPYAGGAASLFKAWADLVSDEIEVCGLQLPGRAQRLKEAALLSVRQVVEAVGPSSVPLLDVPYAFFGHSMGALVSFELARWLRSNGQRNPTHLFVAARRAPHLPRAQSSLFRESDEKFIQALVELQGTPSEVLNSPELLNLLLPTIRADFGLLETYSYAPDIPLNCPITAIGGEMDPETQNGGLEEWKVQTAERFKSVLVPGSHFFIHSYYKDLANLITQELTAFPEDKLSRRCSGS